MSQSDSVKVVPPGSVIDFANVITRLKLTKRTGWVKSGISGPESIADHMYRMSMLAMLITDATVDRNRLVKSKYMLFLRRYCYEFLEVCLVHDLAESIVGDITPHCGVSKEEKRNLEEVSWNYFLSQVIT